MATKAKAAAKKPTKASTKTLQVTKADADKVKGGVIAGPPSL